MPRFALTIGPNTRFPDWSAVTSPLVEAALLDLLREDRMLARWQGLGEAARDTHRAILQSFRETGRAPRLAWLAERRRLAAAAIARHLDELVARDLVVCRQGEIEGAYPFTDRDTGHVVEIGEVSVNAMCAIDALGIGALLGRPTLIRSRCAHCAGKLRIGTGNDGRSITGQVPPGIVVWAGVEPIHGCAADTQCRSMVFYCSAEHLDAAQGGEPVSGYRFSTSQALEAGAAIFGPFL
ncbi:hypothetical protein LNKW23_37380 [Paralimibaculum aggregatum]|uniref:Alkylmercury lyase n=1 Tax=Paralimibaculum aggregatum TaxID=3036245 RepID=A0ABQ6LNE4_9RHOB|nr:alkylmercury lyase family protein [Limibaculum sp. NKW23]GMG84522.1 hypothetical protein LNKW23_37380 [Limibaculum sp. NKW23]